MLRYVDMIVCACFAVSHLPFNISIANDKFAWSYKVQYTTKRFHH